MSVGDGVSSWAPRASYRTKRLSSLRTAVILTVLVVVVVASLRAKLLSSTPAGPGQPQT